MLKQSLKNRLFQKGYRLHRVTPTPLLRQTIEPLRPWQTQHPLIRLGGQRDGGYLVPDDLEEIAACFSPGVYDKATFETDLETRGIPAHLADRSVDAPPEGLHHATFDPVFLGQVDDEQTVTLDSWVRRHRPDPAAGDLMLQMDIEGAEYEVLLHASRETLRRFRIIVLELHALEKLWDPGFARMFRMFCHKFQHEFTCVHLHPNNYFRPVVRDGVAIPPLIEVTLLRNDRIESRQPVVELPHPLDNDNVTKFPPLAMPRCWYE